MTKLYKLIDQGKAAMASSNGGVIDAATGVGKGVLISHDAAVNLNIQQESVITLTVGHRILLTQQLQDRINKYSYNVFGQVPFKRIGVMSGSVSDIEADTIDERIALASYPETVCHSVFALVEEIKDAIATKSNISLYATYHSLHKVVEAVKICGVKINVSYNDEIHVPAANNEQWASIEAAHALTDKAYCLSATIKKYKQKIIGLFGPVIFHLPPNKAIEAGLICKPVWMIAEVEGEREKSLATGIVKAFKRHDKANRFDVKALVNLLRKEEILAIVNSKEIQELGKKYPNLMLADISSEYGPRVNGIRMSRPDWIKTINEHNGPMIVLHIDICNAGIDVPDFNLPIWTYLPNSETYRMQGNGRGSRLSHIDRVALEEGTISVSDRSKWHKPYNTVCLLAFTETPQEDIDEFIDFIVCSREEGFEPNDTIYVNASGSSDPFPLPPGNGKSQIETAVQVRLEDQALQHEIDTVREMSADERTLALMF